MSGTDGKSGRAAIALLLGILALLAVVFSSGCPQFGVRPSQIRGAQPDWSPDGRLIAYSAINSVTGLSEIYTATPEGANLRRLTSQPRGSGNGCDSPKWSPQGDEIAYNYGFYGGDPVMRKLSIYVMKSDGTKPTNLSPGRDDSTPSWSPDGRRIAFSSWRNRYPQIHIMNRDGTGQTQVTNSLDAADFPVWSPDGARIAFTGIMAGTQHIYVMKPDGTNLIDLMPNSASRYNTMSDWSPDGSRIVFVSLRDASLDVYVMDADGSNETRVTSSGDNRYPTWSPDGKRIAFTHGRASIQIIDVD